MLEGWPALLADRAPFRRDGRYAVAAYSEYMPGPSLGIAPHGWIDRQIVPDDDPFGFRISEYQDAHQLRPGMEFVARQLGEKIRRLACGERVLSADQLEDNPYFPSELADRVASLRHEKLVTIASLALSRTLDDKGRIRWTVYGASEQGPGRAFFRSFYSAPDRAVSEESGVAMIVKILSHAYDVRACNVEELLRAGFRILPSGVDPDFPRWADERLPAWARPLVLADDAPVDDVRFLLTFRAFSRLPSHVKREYLAQRLAIVPFPGSLVFFGHRGYRTLARELSLAMQIPLLRALPGRHVAPAGFRIPQSGWLDEGGKRGLRTHGPVVSTVKRTHRWNRSHRDEDEWEKLAYEDRVTDALFAIDEERLGLYDKPMARNAQIWTEDYRLLLDGPSHGRFRIDETACALRAGGHFGYRFQFPPMRVGPHDVYWHRPAIVVQTKEGESSALLDSALGFLTAYRRNGAEVDEDRPIELFPRIDDRPLHRAAVELFANEPSVRRHATSYNVRKLLEASELLGDPLSPSLARALLTLGREVTLDDFLGSLADRVEGADAVARARELSRAISERIEDEEPTLVEPYTFDKTATRDFEVRYWKTIQSLAEGRFVQKNQADAIPSSQGPRAVRDLDALGDHLCAQHRALVAKHRMKNRALVGEHAFRWETEFDFPWSRGWSESQTAIGHERNLVVVIPGRDRSEAVIMADHYDTAYMEDVYERKGKKSRRAAAHGADDNYSATAALLLAADVLLPLAREGKLARDVWLVHLTGEEFPADSLGARHLVQRLVEGNFAIVADGHGRVDLSRTRVRGACILDMVAHDNDRARGVFQIAPGQGAEAMELAAIAHRANERWNAAVPRWNARKERKRAAAYVRPKRDDAPPPKIAPHRTLLGEVRPHWHYASTVYNTDAVHFSDAGIPVVLFMENYDIDRTGYHDTHDTMKNIDLDYGAALAAIAIETVADAAMGS